MRKRYTLVLLFVGGLLMGCRGRNRSDAPVYDAARHAGAHPVVVFGGGVAGLTAANYTLQANLPCLLVEGGKPGGALAQSDSVRNWPGVVDAPGGQIVDGLKKQVLAASGSVVAENLVSLDLSLWPYKAVLADALTPSKRREISFLTGIMAMGAEPNYLGVPGERGNDGYWGKGVTNCAVCDGSLCRGKVVGVVGGGDAAMTEAGYLAGIAKQVFVFVRKGSLRAKDTRKVEQVRQQPNVTFVFNTEVIAMLGDGQRLQAVELVDTVSKQKRRQALDGLFLSIGSRPNTTALAGQLALDQHGYLVVDDRQRANVPGIFAAGDLCDPRYKQAVTSAGQGCKAALEAQEFLAAAGYAAPSKAATVVEPQGVASRQDSFVVEIESLEQLTGLLARKERPLFVDLYSTMCIPCKEMAPLVERLARAYDGVLTVVKVNLSNRALDAQEVAKMLGIPTIEGVPLFAGLQKNGKLAFKQLGQMPYERLEGLAKKLRDGN